MLEGVIRLARCATILTVLCGCISNADWQRLRASEAEGARTHAILECMIATHQPRDSEIVRDCARVMAPAVYNAYVAQDNASIRQHYEPSAPVEIAAPYTAPTTHAPRQPYMPSPMPTAITDPCAMMSCPRPASPVVRYVPVAPGDPLNAGLNSAGYPTR